MPYCDECGFHLEEGDCDMCDSDVLQTESNHSQLEETSEVYQDANASEPIDKWWYGVLIGPGLLLAAIYIASYFEAGFPIAVMTAILLFNISLARDIRYIQNHTTGWEPRYLVWVGISLFNVATLGVIMFLVTPYYFYKRQSVTVE